MHMAEQIPLPLTVSCFSKIQIGFTFLVPADPGSPGQTAVKWVCVCKGVRVCVCKQMLLLYCICILCCNQSSFMATTDQQSLLTYLSSLQECQNIVTFYSPLPTFYCSAMYVATCNCHRISSSKICNWALFTDVIIMVCSGSKLWQSLLSTHVLNYRQYYRSVQTFRIQRHPRFHQKYQSLWQVITT